MNTIYDILPTLTNSELKELSECILNRMYRTTWSLRFCEEEPLEELNLEFLDTLPQEEYICKAGVKPLQGIYKRLVQTNTQCQHTHHYITQRCPQSQQKVSWFAVFQCTACHNQMCDHPMEDYMTCADCFAKAQCELCMNSTCKKRPSNLTKSTNTHTVACHSCNWYTAFCNTCKMRICLCETCDSDVCICHTSKVL